MKAFSKDVLRTVGSSKKRFFSIMIICALGVTMFVGLAVGCLDLRRSADRFFDEQGLFDVGILSTLGLTEGDVEVLGSLEGVDAAEGAYEQPSYTGVLGHQATVDVKALSEQGINMPYVLEGRLPQEVNEVAVTSAYLEDSGYSLGDTVMFTARDSGDDAADPLFAESPYVIVGSVIDPTNVIEPDGSTAFRSSTSADYTFYVPRSAASGDVYTAIYLRADGTDGLDCYSRAYEERVESLEDEVLGVEDAQKQLRVDTVRSDALAAVDEAQAEADQSFAEAEQQMADAQAQIDAGMQAVADNRAALDAQAVNYDYMDADSQAQIDAGYESIAASESELQASQAQLDEERASFEQERSDAQAEIDEARADAEGLEATWYVQNRMSLGGYASIDSDASSIETIAAVLPVIFLIVAVLVSLTTGMRMVEEQRGLIGIYKALGYSKARIMGKYVIYMLAASLIGSIVGDLLGFFALPAFLFGIFRSMYILPEFSFFFDAASLIGSIVGDLLGFFALPAFLFGIFRSMYILPEFSFFFDGAYAFGGIALFVVAIVGATAIACNRDLRQVPAVLMRPKAPKAGKRILLERVGPLWKSMGFLNKVTARNIFRYKARFLMTVFGILGCTMLLVCGFAIKNTVDSLASRQYDDVYGYGLMAVVSPDDLVDVQAGLEGSDEVDSLMALFVDNATVTNEDEKTSMQLFVVPEGESLVGYIDLRDDGDGSTVDLPAEGVVITDNAARLLGVEQGSTVEVRDSMLDQVYLPVAEVVTNYLGNALYMSQEAYEEAFGPMKTNALLAVLTGDGEEQIAFADALGEDDRYRSITSVAQLKADFSSAFALIDGIVYIVIVLAAGLAFVVLFTLSTTNIAERQRELATLKVLGFRRGEVHRYVNKETMLLTLVGVLLGLPAGYLLSYSFKFLLKLPAINFATYVSPWTYLIAAAITFVFAFAVSLITNRMLDRINMVEALKSPE